MTIHKLANVIAFPFILMAFALGYLTFKNPDSNYLVWGLIPALGLVLTYLFSPQINYWWLSKKPVQMDSQITNLLAQVNPYYDEMSPGIKNEFHKRLLLFTEGKEFLAKGMEKETMAVPYDVQNMISQIPVMMTRGREKFTLKHFDRIILYKHPFPTPMNKFLHTMEIHAEDGVVILSLEHVQAAMMQPSQHYDVGYHAFAEAFIAAHPNEAYPELTNDIWDKINQISPQNRDQILGTLGFPEIDPMPVLITLYFRHRAKFEKVLPNISRKLADIFRDDNPISSKV